MTQITTKETKLPPSPFVREFANMPLPDVCFSVLDVGCGAGRNAKFMASLGHKVIALSPDIDELQSTQNDFSKQITLVAGKAQDLMFRDSSFDIVLMNEVLHQIPLSDRQLAMSSLKRVTKPGGYHVVSDYIGANEKALSPLELQSYYPRGAWETARYDEEVEKQHMYPGGQLLNSLASIVALKQ